MDASRLSDFECWIEHWNSLLFQSNYRSTIQLTAEPEMMNRRLSEKLIEKLIETELRHLPKQSIRMSNGLLEFPNQNIKLSTTHQHRTWILSAAHALKGWTRKFQAAEGARRTGHNAVRKSSMLAIDSLVEPGEYFGKS